MLTVNEMSFSLRAGLMPLLLEAARAAEHLETVYHVPHFRDASCGSAKCQVSGVCLPSPDSA